MRIFLAQNESRRKDFRNLFYWQGNSLLLCLGTASKGSFLLQRKSITCSLIWYICPDYFVLYFQCITTTYFSFLPGFPEDSTCRRITSWHILREGQASTMTRGIKSTSSLNAIFEQLHWCGHAWHKENWTWICFPFYWSWKLKWKLTHSGWVNCTSCNHCQYGSNALSY